MGDLEEPIPSSIGKPKGGTTMIGIPICSSRHCGNPETRTPPCNHPPLANPPPPVLLFQTQDVFSWYHSRSLGAHVLATVVCPSPNGPQFCHIRDMCPSGITPVDHESAQLSRLEAMVVESPKFPCHIGDIRLGGITPVDHESAQLSRLEAMVVESPKFPESPDVTPMASQSQALHS